MKISTQIMGTLRATEQNYYLTTRMKQLLTQRPEAETLLRRRGEEVTIILCRDYLLVNSRTTGSQPFTFNRDIVNYKKLSEILEYRITGG